MKRRQFMRAGAKGLVAISIAAMVAGSIAPAMAHGPERKKVTETIEISVPPEKAWERVKNFADMSWHPAVEKTEGEGGNAVDATRTITLKGGGEIHEMLTRYDDEKMTYSYRISDVDVAVLPVTNYASHLTVKPGTDGGSLVEWRGAFYRGYPNNDPPEHLNNEAAIAAVTGVYKAGLANLKATLEGSQ